MLTCLVQILEAIGDEKLAGMQRALKCASQHFVYSSITGGFMGETGGAGGGKALCRPSFVSICHGDWLYRDA